MDTIHDGLAKFCDVYEKKLRNAVQEHPDEYAYPLAEVSMVVNRMMTAFGNGSFNKDSRAIKEACKELGIKHTYKDMRVFFNSGTGY